MSMTTAPQLASAYNYVYDVSGTLRFFMKV